ADRISKVEIRLTPEANAKRVAEQLQTLAGEQVKVLTRHQSNSLYRLMALEKWGVFGVAALVLLIASLSIVGAIVMAMIEKRDDMQTLRTMGATEKVVEGIFISEGLLMATLSVVAGVVVGVALTLLQQHFGIIRLDAASLAIDAYPVELRWGDVVMTAATYMAIATLVVRLTVRAMMRGQRG
ncbi:MAG: FtsX-like permease family protein, partial [Alistipes sp.]|nr:FtsX-like permease family protein [Alistipes sp.]